MAELEDFDSDGRPHREHGVLQVCDAAGPSGQLVSVFPEVSVFFLDEGLDWSDGLEPLRWGGYSKIWAYSPLSIMHSLVRIAWPASKAFFHILV